MNTKVKVGIAAAIVAALVALIVLDQKTTPKDEASRPSDGNVATGGAPSVDRAPDRLAEEEVRNLIQRAEEGFRKAQKPEKAAPPTTIKAVEPENIKEPGKVSSGEEYVILEGDTYETIAEKKYGSRNFSQLIADANPNLKATALRVGRKIALPPKPEKPVDAAVASVPAPKTGLESVAGQKVYTIQPGDTLSGISVKVYNTSRHTQKIWETNRDRIDDPNTLIVGTKLTMPDLPVRGAASPVPSGAVPTAAVPLSPTPGKVHAVQPSESLWKIAEKYAGEKGVGILDMITSIVKANPEKLKDEKTLLRLGWQLVIPD